MVHKTHSAKVKKLKRHLGGKRWPAHWQPCRGVFPRIAAPRGPPPSARVWATPRCREHEFNHAQWTCTTDQDFAPFKHLDANSHLYVPNVTVG